MKCKGCGLEVANVGELTKHKKSCPANTIQAEQVGDPEAVINASEMANHQIRPPQEGFFIPLALCPEEIKLYAIGKTLGLHINGELTPAGVKVQEVTLIR